MGEKINNILKGEIISSVFYILLGLCLILIPTQTVDVICKVVFGLILIGAGIYHIYIYIRGKAKATIMDLLSGVVVFVLGVFLFMTPSIVIKLLPWMLSAFVLVDSLWKFKGAFLLKKGGNGAWSVLLIGSLVFIALGIVMLFGRFPKIMTLLIFSGWVLVCDGAADIVFYIIMKLGLRKIAKKAETEKEDSGADSSDAVNETADMDVTNDTRNRISNRNYSRDYSGYAGAGCRRIFCGQKRDRRIYRTGRRAKAEEFPMGKRTGECGDEALGCRQRPGGNRQPEGSSGRFR